MKSLKAGGLGLRVHFLLRSDLLGRGCESVSMIGRLISTDPFHGNEDRV